MFHFNLNNSYWAEPSDSHLSSLLRVLYSTNKSDIDLKINNAYETIKSFSWSKNAKKNISFVQDRLCLPNNKYSKIGWISTWNRRCGIA